MSGPARVDRRAIRDEVVARLRDLGLSFDRRVFANRVRPLADAQLPACVVWTLSEDLEVVQAAPRVYRRKLQLVVQLAVGIPASSDPATDRDRPSDGLDDALDGLVLEVEQRLERDQTLGGLVVDVRHARFDLDLQVEGRERVAFARLTEEVTYETEAPERPEAGFDTLRTIESSLGPPGSGAPPLRDSVHPDR